MKRSKWLFILLPLMALALVIGIVTQAGAVRAAASSQSASPSHILGIRSYQTSGPGISGSGQNMIYHGGPIMPATSVDYAIFWQPTGSIVPKTFNSLIERYFNDIGQSALYHNNVQYTDVKGQKPLSSTFGGAWVDTQPYPANFITDAQLQQEVSHAMQVNGWKSSLDHVFFVFTVAGERICFNNSQNQCSPNSFCAYHSWFGHIIYAAMPDVLCGTPDSPNHDRQADNVIDSTSHEQNEAASDPLGNAWFNRGGAEIGDLCSTSYGPLKFHGGDLFLNGHPYTTQEEWDNAQSACVIAGP